MFWPCVMVCGIQCLVSLPQEDSILTQNHSGEGHVVFAGGCLPRAGRSRKVPLSAKKVESIAILCPVSRSKIKANKKEQFTACGEESTYQGTYSGVSYRSGAEIPLISPLEKSKVLPQSRVHSIRASQCHQMTGPSATAVTFHCFGANPSRSHCGLQ